MLSTGICKKFISPSETANSVLKARRVVGAHGSPEKAVRGATIMF